MKKAILTGAGGFLGAHLACTLHSKGLSVTCILHKADFTLFNKIAKVYQLSAESFEWIQADILDPTALCDAFIDADVVFHCAAIVSFKAKDNEALYEVNVDGTRNVVNACLKVGVKHLVYSSSVAALGRKKGKYEVNEDAEWIDSPLNSTYAISKHLAELEVWRGMEEGLNVSIVNPGIILGLGDGINGSNAIFHHVKQKLAYYPVGRNGFVGVEDVCAAMHSMYAQHVCGVRILMVAENLYYKDLMGMVAENLQVPAPKKPLNGIRLKMAIGIAKLAEFLHIPFPFPSQGLKSTSSDTQYVPINVGKIKDFAFTPISQVIKNTVGQMRA